MVARPFSHDPSATAAFAALRESQPVVARDERLRVVVIGGGTGAPVSIPVSYTHLTLPTIA